LTGPAGQAGASDVVGSDITPLGPRAIPAELIVRAGTAVRRRHRAPILTELCGFRELPLRRLRHPDYVSERNLAMTTILLLNAASSLLALVGIAGFFALRERYSRRRPAVQVLYVTTGQARRLPHS
jgi:hypothetical protein